MEREFNRLFQVSMRPGKKKKKKKLVKFYYYNTVKKLPKLFFSQGRTFNIELD
jgi:hypothetical protein